MRGEQAQLLAQSDRPALTLDRSSSAVSAIAMEICGGVVAHMIFAVIFGIFLASPSYYTPECEKSLLYMWSQANFYYFSVASVLTIVVSPLMIWTMKKNEQNKQFCYNFAHAVLNLIRIGVGFMAIFLWIGLCVAYSKSEEDCGKLGDLVFAYIIFVSVAIFIGCCFLMGLFCILYIFQKTQRNGNDIEKSQEFERLR